jgi:hypothetical protein
MKVKEKFVALFLILLPGCLAYSNSEIGLGFSDLMTLFKIGYVEGIMGSWTLAALGLVGIALFLGIGMGLSTDLLLILTTTIGVSLVTMSLLPPILSVIIAIVVAIFIYMIYIRLFRR